ncbi:MAG: Zn-dependent hydrolase [Gemmatimonadetes bacterium]|nr:Zn-dependent hydrolase [Gemmatimonadota bacterium]
MPSRREFSRTSLAALGAAALGRWPGVDRHVHQGVRVNGERLNGHLKALSAFGANPQGGVSRVAYSEYDKQGREYAMGLMRAAGLTVTIDTAGNIHGTRAGSDPARKPLWFGSHIDSVPEGGNYDGPVGSLGAIEVAQTLQERGIITRHPLHVVLFQNEEGGTVGSRAVVGELHEADLDLGSRSGKTIRNGITFIGGNPARLAEARKQPGEAAAYIELHIEQGGNLDKEQLNIGVVEGIVGIGWWDVTIEGFANHAGTTAMNDRRDAMLAFARYTDMVNRVVTSEPGRQVGTVGMVMAFPGARNVIPGKVQCSLELRDLDNAKITRLFEKVRTECVEIGRATGTTFSFQSTHQSASAMCDPGIMATIASQAKGLGLSHRPMPSGAGHDAQHMAKVCPSAMIFVPSIKGISHAPQEYSTPQDITNGANVLLQTLLALDTK